MSVADTELHSAGRTVPQWERVFADTQKKVKRHDNKCAVAASRGEALGSLRVDAKRSMACTGSATWSLAAGSRTRKDLRRWITGKARLEPAPARRESQYYPSST
jgi:hypothetical protein